MKIDRLIGILSVLLQQDKVTAPYLAEKFEVSVRTINRDMETLNRSGIPIASGRGKNGGFYIMDGYRVDRTLLTSSDMRALLAGLRSLDSVCGTGKYRRLMEKLSAGTSSVLSSNDYILIDLSSWYGPSLVSKIECIQNAISLKETVSFTYYAPAGESKRTMEPYLLLFRWSSWYVWGYCTLRRDWRMFKLNRLFDLQSVGKKREERRVPNFQCEKFIHTGGEVHATVRFSNRVKWRVIDEYGFPEIKTEKDTFLFTFTWSDKESLFRWILSFGADAEIVEPAEYKKEFGELARKISDKYF